VSRVDLVKEQLRRDTVADRALDTVPVVDR